MLLGIESIHPSTLHPPSIHPAISKLRSEDNRDERAMLPPLEDPTAKMGKLTYQEIMALITLI